MTREREQTVHNKLARQVGGAIACLLAAALLLGLTACGRGQAQQPAQQPEAEPPASVEQEPAPEEPDPVPDLPLPEEPDEEEEHDGFPEPDEEGEPHPTEFSFTQEEFDQLVADVLDGIIQEDMTSMEQARAVFDYVHNNIRYTGHADKESWINGAYVGLTTGKGDCFTYYAVSRALLDALEIENLPVERVGGKTQHFWNLVNCGDGWYHFDSCPRSVKMPSFLSFMVTDEQVEAFTAMAGRSYYDFDDTLLPERATETVTKTWPKPRPVETEEPEAEAPGTEDPGTEEPGAAGPDASGENTGVTNSVDPTEPVLPDEPVLPPDDDTVGIAHPADPNAPVQSGDEPPAEVWVEPPLEDLPQPELGGDEIADNAGGGHVGGEMEAA